MLSPSHKFRVVCKVNFSPNFEIPYGFCERLKNVLAGLVSRGERDDTLALITRLLKKHLCTKLIYSQVQG
jgi:hypothetical protein